MLTKKIIERDFTDWQARVDKAKLKLDELPQRSVVIPRP